MSNTSFSYAAYAEVLVYDGLNGGWVPKGNGFASPSFQNFAVANSKVLAVSPAQVLSTKFGSVTVNSIVEIYPMGLTLPAKPTRYMCSDLFSALVTART